MTAPEARRRFASARLAHLASVDPRGRPHLVPITFALAADTIYSAVDDVERKRTLALRRLANVAANPAVAVLVDHYEEDWAGLWWVRADGHARIIDVSNTEAQDALAALATRYAPYREHVPPGPVLAIDVERWVGWSATDQ